MNLGMAATSPITDVLDQFIPNPDLRIHHTVMIHAPAALALGTARTFDLRRVPLVRLIFRLRAVILRAKAAEPDWSLGFLPVMLGIGWGLLATEPDRWLIAGTVCQPWLGDVAMRPIPPGSFREYSEPNQVKIAWTLEAEPMGEALCRFSTETRVVATDDQARAAFRRYHQRFGIGMAMIRWLLLPAIRHATEDRYRKAATPAPPV